MTGFTLPLDIAQGEVLTQIIDANGKILGYAHDADMAASFAAAINLVCRRSILSVAQSTEKFKENISATQKFLDDLPTLSETFGLDKK